MDSALKVVQLIRVAMITSIVLYVAVGEMTARPSAKPPALLLFYALTFVAVTMVGFIMVVRRMLIAPAAAALATQSSDAAPLNRWRGGYIVSFALAEAIALYGLVLRLLGFTLSQVVSFYIAGVLLLLMLAPRRPSNELT